ncbi:exoribonuclease R [Escherichia coli]|uniref:Exoribonuclease R n=1 Tax=Escherichia coli TaxID=562 RepID=A0A377KEM3_ECOLX|nr:exoribonuclease R [Escherichia coli]
MSQDPFQEREAEKYANPIPSREFILEHLTKREKPASRDELAVELHIEGEEQLEGLRRRLRAMERGWSTGLHSPSVLCAAGTPRPGERYRYWPP